MGQSSSDHRLFGLPGEDLTGVESRALRGALNLERRHVVALANSLGTGDRVTTVELLTNWEKSKGRGYPAALVDALNDLEFAVEAWAHALADDAGAALRPTGDPAVLLRPLGHRRIHQELFDFGMSQQLSPTALASLDSGGGDFWHALADAAIARAAMRLNAQGRAVRVHLDRQPNELVSLGPNPDGQSAPPPIVRAMDRALEAARTSSRVPEGFSLSESAWRDFVLWGFPKVAADQRPAEQSAYLDLPVRRQRGEGASFLLLEAKEGAAGSIMLNPSSK